MAAAVASFATVATEPGEDAFRKLFRFYRQSRRGTADLEAVIDFSTAHMGRGPSPGVPKVQREKWCALTRAHGVPVGSPERLPP